MPSATRPSLALLALAWCVVAQAAGWLLIDTLPLAGSQYYALENLWEDIRPGDALTLERDPDNRHDPRAIRVLWRDRQIGHLPRAHNRPLAAALDRGQPLQGRVGALTRHPDPWRRVVVEVYAGL